MKSRQRNHLIAAGVSRRKFLERAGLATGAVLLAPAILAACGGDDDDSSSSGGTHRRGRGQQGPQGLELDRLHDGPEPERFRENHRHQRRLRRGHQRQQRVLHEDPAQPVEGQGHRPGLDGADRLDGQPAHQPGGSAVGAAARYREVPQPEEPHPRAAERGLGSDAQVQRAVGHRHDRHRVQHQDDRQGDQVDRRFPRRARDEDGAHGDARHRRDLHGSRAVPTPRSPPTPRPGLRSMRWKRR